MIRPRFAILCIIRKNEEEKLCNKNYAIKSNSRIVRSNVTDAGNNQLILSNATASDASRSLLGFSEFSDAELAGFRLRCGIWITFVLATIFVAAAKFYFGYRVSIVMRQKQSIIWSSIVNYSFQLIFLFI